MSHRKDQAKSTLKKGIMIPSLKKQDRTSISKEFLSDVVAGYCGTDAYPGNSHGVH